MKPAARRAGRAIVPIAVGLAGAWAGLTLWGPSDVSMGPFRVQLDAGFGRGVTDIGLPPFGKITADTHLAPIRFSATLQDVRVPRLSDVIAERGTTGLVADVEDDALDRIGPFAMRVLAAAMLGALVLSVLVFRTRWRRVGACLLAAFIAVGGSEAIAWNTFRPSAFLSPTYSGSLALAPKLIGPVRHATDRIEDFRAELTRVVDGAVRAYTSIQTAPVQDMNVVRVLHISDVHLSPLGLDFAREIARGFEVDFVLDTGDLTSFGTRPEDLVVSEVRSFDRPYVFVRGNHDSRTLQAALGAIPSAAVLDGNEAEVEGLTLYGLGHPVFTPNREASVTDKEFVREAREAGERVFADVTALPEAPDIVAVHDDRMAESIAGLVPLVVSGHFHESEARVIDGTLFLRLGTTGGSGFEVYTDPGGIPLSAEVLYFARAPVPTLVAYDLIEQSPESGSLTVNRHLIAQEFGDLTPTPPPVESPTPTPSPSPTPTPPSP